MGDATFKGKIVLITGAAKGIGTKRRRDARDRWCDGGVGRRRPLGKGGGRLHQGVWRCGGFRASRPGRYRQVDGIIPW